MESNAVGMLDSEASDRAVIFVADGYDRASLGVRISEGIIGEGWKKEVDMGSYRCEQFGFQSYGCVEDVEDVLYVNLPRGGSCVCLYIGMGVWLDKAGYASKQNGPAAEGEDVSFDRLRPKCAAIHPPDSGEGRFGGEEFCG